MPDLLAHALLAYGICTLLSTRYEWLSTGYVTVGMAGAFIPDMMKIKLVVPPERVASLLELPFDWAAIHTSGGTLVAIFAGVVLVTESQRRRVCALLSLGAVSHLLADALLLTPSGRSYAILWPLTRYNPPTPGLYLSTSPIPTVAAAVFAAAVWYVVRRDPFHNGN